MTRRERLGLAAIVVVFVALVFRATGYEFVWDDVIEIQHNPSFDGPLGEGLLLTQTARVDPTIVQLEAITLAYDSYRPLLFATYWFEVQAFGRSARAMHVTNLLLGVLAILLAYAIARRWLAKANLDTLYALPVAAIFALHPLQIEPVAYISGRGDLLAGLLALATTYAMLRAFDGRDGRRRWLAFAGVAFAGSLLSKESYIALPFALVVAGAGFAPIKTRAWMCGVLVGVAIGYLGLRAALVSPTTGSSLQHAIAGAPGTWLEYLRIFLLPFDLSISRLHADLYTIPGWLALGAIAIVVGARRGRFSPAVQSVLGGLAWFALLAGPAAVTIMASGVAADRYCYAPLLGIAIAAVTLIALAETTRPRWRIAIRAVAGLWGALLLVVGVRQVPTWTDNETLYVHAVTMEPASSEAHYRLGFLSARIADWERAFPLLERAVELDPNNVRALNNLGVGYMQTGRFADAEPMLVRALDANPAHFRSWFNLGLTRLALGKRELGCTNLGRALELNPRYAAARNVHAKECATR